MKLLLRQVIIVDPTISPFAERQDILIEEGIIRSISPKYEGAADRSIESQGWILMPGWLDIGTQIGDPGFEHREDLDSVRLAAARGGYTGLCTFPNTHPVVDQKGGINYQLRASQELPVQLYPIGAVTQGCSGKDITEMIDMHRAGAIAFSDGELPIQHNGIMLRALHYVKAFDGLVVNRVHDQSIAGEGQLHEGRVSTLLGLTGIPSLAEEMMLQRDLDLLDYADSRLHVYGISSARSVALIRRAKERGLRVTSSVPVLNLIFTDQVLLDFDAAYKVLPPLRSEADRTALLGGLADGTIDAVVANHVPLEEEKKKLEYAYADFGTIGLQTVYSLLNEYLDMEAAQVARLLSSGPRRCMQLPAVRIAEGELANLTLLDPQVNWTYDVQSRGSRSQNSPLLGKPLRGLVKGIINGTQSYFTENQ